MAVGNTKVFFVAIFLVFFVIIFLGNTKVFFVVIFPAQEQCIAKLNLTISGKREREEGASKEKEQKEDGRREKSGQVSGLQGRDFCSGAAGVL